MPKRTDINTILVIGSGPIVIGQACEFDYSGAQACKVLKEEGYRVVLVNSNPATIMTDPDLVDRTYVEPITCEFIEKIIEREKPDALLATLGGQTALNAAVELAESGILDKHNVELIGCDLAAIQGREPQALQRSHGRDRCGDRTRRLRLLGRSGACDRIFDRLPRYLAPLVHLGWRGRRRGIEPRRARAHRFAGA